MAEDSAKFVRFPAADVTWRKSSYSAYNGSCGKWPALGLDGSACAIPRTPRSPVTPVQPRCLGVVPAYVQEFKLARVSLPNACGPQR